MANHSQTPSPKTQFANGHEPTNGHARKSPYQQVVEIQQLLLEDIRNPNTKAAARSSCARAFDILEERKRILRMKFKPGDVRASDLDPVRLAWTVRRFKKANRRSVINLPALADALTIETEAQVVEPPTKATIGGTEPEATGPMPPPARKESF
jgi:hypothetical protein